jgi:hypothetical protein
MAGVPSGGNPVKSIIIGVLTTVIAYVIVHFIFDKKGGSEQKKKTKTATIEAWKSIVRYEEISTDNYYAAFCIEDPAMMLETMAYEKDQLSKNYEILKAKPDLDEDMASFLARAIGYTNETKKVLADFAADLQRSKEDNVSTDEEKTTKINALEERYTKKLDFIRPRETEAIAAIFKTLSDKYGSELAYTEDSSFTQDDIIGKWKETGIDKTFEFNTDYSLTMVASNETYPGTWKLNDRILTITFSDGSIDHHIVRMKDKYYRFKVNDEVSERQCCKITGGN